MLKSLTKEQQERLDKHCIEFREKILSNNKQITFDEAKEAIDYLYKFTGQTNKPFIIIMDSFLESQLAANYCALINLSLGGNQVKNQVGNQVGSQVWSQVRNQVWNQVKNQEKVFFGQYYFGLFYESYWVTFYNFWIDEKIIKNEFLKRWTLHLMNGIYNIIILENFVIITRCPKKINLDDSFKLHSVTQESIYDQYYIHGVFFEKELWEKVAQRKLNPKEVMKMKNIEQRRVTINHYGWDEIFDYFDKKLINKSKRNSKAELYRVKGLAENIEINIVKYEDPSTGRMYVSQVPDMDDYNKEILTADHAMAWKSYMSLDEYENLKIEA